MERHPEEYSINILCVDTNQGDNIFPSPFQLAARTSQISANHLAENLTDLLVALGETLSNIPDSCGQFDVDEITVGINIDGSGKVVLIGELAAGFKSSLSISLKKPRNRHE